METQKLEIRRMGRTGMRPNALALGASVVVAETGC